MERLKKLLRRTKKVSSLLFSLLVLSYVLDTQTNNALLSSWQLNYSRILKMLE